MPKPVPSETVLLIPYTSADHACYAFQLPAYTAHFRGLAIDLPGSGQSDAPPGPYSTEGYADQVASLLGAIGIEQANVVGASLGAAIAMHLGAPGTRAACAPCPCIAGGTRPTPI